MSNKLDFGEKDKKDLLNLNKIQDDDNADEKTEKIMSQENIENELSEQINNTNKLSQAELEETFKKEDDHLIYNYINSDLKINPNKTIQPAFNNIINHNCCLYSINSSFWCGWKRLFIHNPSSFVNSFGMFYITFG